MPRKRPASQDWRPAFIEAFRKEMTITQACRAAGIGRQTVYDERKRNEDFARAWEDLEFEITERLEREAYRRAVEGVVEKGTYDKDGKLVGDFVVRYSDRMMETLLRARAPHKYRENVHVEQTGSVRYDHQVTLLDGREPVELPAGDRRAAARALLGAGVVDGREADGSSGARGS